ncbi:hypothetical protein BN844_2128 [Pseudomonas sp. SHC52]|nr:hypothetical protein BN844_2128 [Pseudomonas sp. SHC52]
MLSQVECTYARWPFPMGHGLWHERYTYAILDQLDDGLQFIQLTDFTQGEMHPPQEAIDLPATEGRTVVSNEGLAGEQFRPVFSRNITGDDQAIGLQRQGGPAQIALEREGRADDDRHVDFAGIHQVDQFHRQARNDPRPALWALLVEPGQRVGQIGALDGRDGADIHQGAGGQSHGGGAEVVIKTKQLLSLQEYLVAHPVEVGRTAFPVENLETEFGLQTLDLGADRCLGEADPVPGSGERTFPGHGDKCLEFFDHSQILIVILKNIY